MTAPKVVGGEASLATRCLDFCQALDSQGSTFSFSLTLGSSFSFSLDTRGARKESLTNIMVRKKVSPSTLRRNERRKEDFLKKSRNQEVSEKEAEERNVTNKENGLAEQREVTKEKERKEEKEQSGFKCERCGYRAKTKNTLKKHLTSKQCSNVNREEMNKKESECENENGGSGGKGCDSCDSTDCCEKQNCDFTANQAQCKWCQNLFVEALVKTYNPGDINTAAYRAIRAAG